MKHQSKSAYALEIRRRSRRTFLRLTGAAAVVGAWPVVTGGRGISSPAAAADGARFAPRIPTRYFRTGGTGTSWQGLPPDPYETFSYDVALLQAGIEDFNVVPYTSVMPPECHGNEVPISAVAPHFHPGSVLEVIMAKIGAEVNPRAKTTLCSAVGIVWAAEKDTPATLRNGYAAEYEFNHSGTVGDDEARAAAEKQVNASLDHELAIRGLVEHKGSKREYRIDVLQLAYAENESRYGTCLSALGFVEFIFPPPYPT
jgi:pyruvoyl-dependent arginine decarboxylase